MGHPRAVVVVDYQNMHLTARGRFTPQGAPTHHSLLHPLNLANQVLAARSAAASAAAAAKRKAPPHAATVKLDRVEVFRGLPSNAHDAKSYSRSLAQRAEWTRDQRVNVTYRPLRYQWENGIQVPREKGIDVLVALKLVELARTDDYDLVILAAHDTDLEPAIEAALSVASVNTSIETTGWDGCKRLKVAGTSIWHTFLGQTAFSAARDLKQY